MNPIPCQISKPVLVLALFLILAPGIGSLQATDADIAYKRGLILQQDRRTEDAIQAYREAIKLHPDHGPAHYEIGWSYWVLGDWPQVVEHWQAARSLGAMPASAEQYFAEARRNLAGDQIPLVRPDIGISASGRSESLGNISLELIARFQHYNPRPVNAGDRFDRFIFSPKSVRFLTDGTKAYVNALEGFATVVYDPKKLRRTNVIIHRFKSRHSGLFSVKEPGQWLPFPAGAPANPNEFDGKPVESALSVDGKYLWVPYYRRSYDNFSVMPSAMAVIDTQTDKIVRVMSTGPIPKYVVPSPDGKWLAVIHWGDNTVGLIDASSDDPRKFSHAGLVTVGTRVDLSQIEKKDRDHGCGYCLRGAVFSADSQYLLVARMGGGGIAVIDMLRQRYVGTVHGMRQTPRHLVLSSDGETLYLSSSFAGYVSAYRTRDLISAALRQQKTLRPLREAYTGPATRTIAISPDDRLIYAAINKESKIVVLEAKTLNKLLELASNSYPVGMAVSPDGQQLWVTAQGRNRRGGNSVTVYRVSTDR